MPDLTAHVPMAVITNPILLWLFKHGWEDPDWGHLPINQVALGLALHDLGNKLANGGLREQVQAIGAKVVAENAQRAVKEVRSI